MTYQIHPTAIVDPSAELGPDVVVAPYAIIGPNVLVGDGTTIGSHVVIERSTHLGAGCSVGAGAVLGAAPQDLKYAGQDTLVTVGNGTVIRELVTINRGVTGPTSIGSNSFIMTYAHIAHDCTVGSHVTIGNAVQCAGHVVIEDYANVGGLTPIHQFVRIGKRAFVGGGSRVPVDVPPFALAAGSPLRLCGINVEGLRRAGFSSERRANLKRAFRLLFNSKLLRDEAIPMVDAEFEQDPDVQYLLAFVAESRRSVLA